MKFVSPWLASLFSICLAVSVLGQDDWQNWRGPTGNGIADQDQKPPTSWDADKNVIWKTKVPGRGHASPIVLGDKIFLATADDKAKTQSVVCFDRESGKQLWSTLIHRGKFNPRIYRTNTHASSTIATHGGRSLFVVFNNDQAAQLTKLDMDGKIVWQKKAGIFKPTRYQFGFGASPIVHESNVIVASESETEAFVAAFDVESGDEKWRIKRPSATSYSTPVVANVGGREQLLISGGREVAGYSPEDGSNLWKTSAKWSVSCGTMVWDGDLVFASGGYPTKQTLAIRGDNGKVVWQNRVKCYEQSMLALDGHIYALSDNGIAYCWDAKDGTEKWHARMESPVSASPVLAGGHIYFTSQRGNTFVIEANPNEYKLVSKNKLGNDTYATPAFCGNRIYTRIAELERDDRQEWLYCIGSNN